MVSIKNMIGDFAIDCLTFWINQSWHARSSRFARTMQNIIRRHAQNARDGYQPSGRDPVTTLFVFLKLLKVDTESFRDFGL
jgi:hypothetical protein